MYQSKVRHALSPVVSDLAEDDRETLWAAFVAIGRHWELKGDTATLRQRHDAFLRNRISLNPMYEAYYRKGCELIRRVLIELGEPNGWTKLLGDRTNQPLPTPVDTDALAIVRNRIIDEFIAIRLALGGFKDFGAVNYRGYIGGANISGRPAPYRPGEILP